MFSGRNCNVDYACCLNDKKPAKEFVETLTEAEKLKLSHILQQLLDTGKVWNKEKFKKLEEPFWELKSDKNRLLCFKHKNCWILTNGFKKTTQKLKRSYISFAQRIMTEHLQRNP